MADLKPIPGGQAPALRPAGAPVATARAAQRAFFTAALSRTEVAAPAISANAQAPQPPRRAMLVDAPEPSSSNRLLRPGSFLDIKV